MVEALACGTPVIAHDRGSMAELIDDSRTGRLVADLDEASLAVEGVTGLDRHLIRTVAIDRFDRATMVDRYEALYRSVLKGATPRPDRSGRAN